MAFRRCLWSSTWQLLARIFQRDGFSSPEFARRGANLFVMAGDCQQFQGFLAALGILVDETHEEVVHFLVLKAGEGLEQVFLIFGNADGGSFHKDSPSLIA